jgi:L-serine dehydratase
MAEIFKIGIGPSSSHTIGPMKAARLFLDRLGAHVPAVARLRATAYGSLAWTGRGHATDKAMILGLAGFAPETLDPDAAATAFAAIETGKTLHLPDGHSIVFDPARDVVFNLDETYQRHSNAMRFEAFEADGSLIVNELWFSVGGGFVERDGAADAAAETTTPLPFPQTTALDLLEAGRASGQGFAAMAWANEEARRPGATQDQIESIISVMMACLERGLTTQGVLPGGLGLQRRAASLYQKLKASEAGRAGGMNGADFATAYALAVAEENAAGGRIVTAPTNGAAGVVPAVLRYYRDCCAGASATGERDFLLVAALIGALIKHNASISGAEVGCQGEIGAAAAMAAGGLAAALGGTNEQIECAAESALEHHLGLTCDPVKGLVQIPCIERNAFGAVKAIAAASLALWGDGAHHVNLDQAIETMRRTGLDLSAKYKETSLAGLAVTACGFNARATRRAD